MTEDDRQPQVSASYFSSSDVDEAEHHLGRTYTDLSIAVPGDPARFSCHHDAVTTAGIAMSRLTMPLEVTADLAVMPARLVVNVLHGGGMTYTSREYGDVTVAAGDTVAVPPFVACRAVCDHVDVDIVALDAAEVADYAEQVSGVLPTDLVISGIAPISATLAGYWQATVALTRQILFEDSAIGRSPIVRAGAFRSLAAGLLSTFPNSALAQVTDPDQPRPRGRVSEATLREVVDFLDTHSGEPVGPADVTALTGIPAREVVAGLRRRRDVHPSQLLWSARLRGAHRELLDADRDTGTVREIATRWGFARPGRFRVAYTSAFDESPETTLDR